MAGVSWINYKGRDILFVDYKGASTEKEMIAVLLEAQRIIIEHNKEYLQLTDISNTYTTPGYMQMAKKVARETPKIAKKRAMVGINSQARRILLQAYNLMLGVNAIKPFDTIEEAKEFLIG